jgi:hypothetical protein
VCGILLVGPAPIVGTAGVTEHQFPITHAYACVARPTTWVVQSSALEEVNGGEVNGGGEWRGGGWRGGEWRR